MSARDVTPQWLEQGVLRSLQAAAGGCQVGGAAVRAAPAATLLGIALTGARVAVGEVAAGSAFEAAAPADRGCPEQVVSIPRHTDLPPFSSTESDRECEQGENRTFTSRG